MGAKKIGPINSELIRGWIGDDPSKLLRLCNETGLSFHSAYRMKVGNYPSVPKKPTRDLMCKLLGLSENALFPGLAKRAVK